MGDETNWRTITGEEYANAEELLALVEEAGSDLVVSYRNLHTTSWKFPYSLGSCVHVLTQVGKAPVLLLPQAFNDDDGEVLGGITVVVDLAAIQTAKQAGYAAEGTLRGSLERVALEIQSLGIAADVPASARAPLEHPELAGLSPREREILTHLLSAHRVPQIAEALHISQNTVRNHLKSIFQKIGVSSQAALIRKVRSLSS